MTSKQLKYIKIGAGVVVVLVAGVLVFKNRKKATTTTSTPATLVPLDVAKANTMAAKYNITAAQRLANGTINVQALTPDQVKAINSDGIVLAGQGKG